MDTDDSIASALRSVAYQLQCLGTGDTADPRGAMEFLAVELHAGLSEVAEAIEHLATEIGAQRG